MAEPRDPRFLVIALGGRALREAGRLAAPSEWFRSLGRTLPPLVDLVAAGFRLVLTHASRSPMSDALLRVELARKAVPPLTLDLCAAETQGAVGYAIQQVLENLCQARGLPVPVATMLTRVVVDAEDPAFARPGAAVGPAYATTTARRLAREHGWKLVKQRGRGFRRVVPSPRPLRVVEVALVRRLSEMGAVAIAGGGGTVPVVETTGGYRGVEVVIEPDLVAERLATGLAADQLLLLTNVEQAAVNFASPRAVAIEELSVPEARTLLAAGEFPPRSMGPKVEAGVRFVEEGGRAAIITSLAAVRAALDGKVGTRIVR